MRRSLHIALAVAMLPALLATGCGGDDSEESLPPVDKSSSSRTSPDGPTDSGEGSGGTQPSDDPPYSPAPKGPKLADDERAAYKAAVKDVEHWQAIERKLQANPRTGKQMQQMIVRWTYNPYSTRIYKLIREFKSEGVRQVGRTKVFWRVPVRVDLDARDPKVVWRECWGDGTLKWYRDGERINQDPRPPQQTRVLMIASERGRWHVSKAKDAGTCGA